MTKEEKEALAKQHEDRAAFREAYNAANLRAAAQLCRKLKGS